MPPKKATTATESTRRSARVASASSDPAAKKAAPKKGAPSKKRSKEEVESEDGDEATDDGEAEKPKTKKVCTKLLRNSPASLVIDRIAYAADEQAKTALKKKPAAAKKEGSASGELQIGDTIPDTTLQNEKEEDVNVKQLAENGLVMFVVPKADTREQD